MRTIIIWFNPIKNVYYHRIVCNIITKYEVGYVNKYGHKVVDVIDLRSIFYKEPLKNKVIKRVIAFLHKLEK